MTPTVMTVADLRDLAEPAAVSGWPASPAMIGLGLLVGFGGLFLAWSAWRTFRDNAYRRAGLVLLDQLLPTSKPDAPRVPVARAVSSILKRVALAAYPRTEVASLSGEAWQRFLDRTGNTRAFTEGPGRILGETHPPSDPDLDVELLAAARRWIRTHPLPSPRKPSPHP